MTAAEHAFPFHDHLKLRAERPEDVADDCRGRAIRVLEPFLCRLPLLHLPLDRVTRLGFFWARLPHNWSLKSLIGKLPCVLGPQASARARHSYPSAGPRGTRYGKREKGKWQKGRWAENNGKIGVPGIPGRQKNEGKADWGKDNGRRSAKKIWEH